MDKYMKFACKSPRLHNHGKDHIVAFEKFTLKMCPFHLHTRYKRDIMTYTPCNYLLKKDKMSLRFYYLFIRTLCMVTYVYHFGRGFNPTIDCLTRKKCPWQQRYQIITIKFN
uniref:Uncharacterized protein n=1 Tax=Cacopsylla melanoneura TaxID=428564 RepID=A0A8D8TX93_9HEMI